MNRFLHRLRYNPVTDWVRHSRYTRKYSESLYNTFVRYWLRKNGLPEISKVTLKLNGNGVRSFADFGTLLGLVREGCLIAHDLDIDIGVIVKDDSVYDKVKNLFFEMGYRISREFAVSGSVKEQTFIGQHIKIDIFYYFPYDDEKIYCFLFYTDEDVNAAQYKSVKKICPAINDIRIREFSGHRIAVPENALEFVESKYGKQWRTPEKGWVYWQGPNTQRSDELGELRAFE